MEGLRFSADLSKREAVIKARDWLRRVVVDAHSDKFTSELSGGEQQRVAIARALAVSPRMLMLDEPTTGLDPTASGKIMELLKELKESGLTLLIVSHQIDFIRRAADYVYFLDAGKIREEGHARQVL